MERAKLSSDNFYKRVSSGRSHHGLSQSNFYIPSNKSETYSTLIQILKGDLLTIQDMINSNSKDIKMYKLLSKIPGLTKKLSEIDESKNISIFIDKITEQSGNIDKINKIYGTKSANECIQKLFLECGLNDLLIKKVCDFFILMKLKINNDDSYQESLSKIISIRDFMEKVPSGNNDNSNLNINDNNNNDNKEIEDFLKINSLNELLDLNVKNKKIYPHVAKLVDNYFKNINTQIIDTINNYNYGKESLNEIEDFKGSQVEKYNKLNDICDNILIDYNNKIENLLNKENDTNDLNDPIKELNEKYEKQKEELNIKIEQIKKENEDLSNKINSNKDVKYSSKEINEINQNSIKEKNKIEETYQSQINILNNEIKNLKDKLSELNKKEEELNYKENNNNIIISKENKPEIINLNLDQFIEKYDSNYIKKLEKSNENLDNEISELQTKFNKLSGELSLLQIENSELKRQLELNQSNNFDDESYEQVLLQQFEIMKKAFITKIENLTIELNKAKQNSRKKTYQIEQNIKESEHLKNIFLQQVVNLQKQLGNTIL